MIFLDIMPGKRLFLISFQERKQNQYVMRGMIMRMVGENPVGQGEKLTEQVLVRISEQDLIFINKFIQDSGGDMSPGAAFRSFLKYFKIDYQEIGPSGCLLKIMDKI